MSGGQEAGNPFSMDLLGKALQFKGPSIQLSKQDDMNEFLGLSPKEPAQLTEPASSPSPNVPSMVQSNTEVIAPRSSITNFEENNKALVLSGKKHKVALDLKAQLETRTQQTHSQLWTFPKEEKTIEGFCGCNAVVSYSYTFNIALFNNVLYESLFQQFLELHEHNIDAVFMTLYEQTVSELQLSRSVHSQAPLLKSMGGVECFEFVKERIDILFCLLTSSSVLSIHSKELLQSMVVYLGSYMLPNERDSAPSSSPSISSTPAPLIDILSGGTDTKPSNNEILPQKSVNKDAVVVYFVEKLADVCGFTWGHSLVQLSISQLEKYHLLQFAVSELAQQATVSEREYISLLSQFPWEKLSEFSTIKSLQRELLVPLRSIQQFAAEKNYTHLLALLGNILIACAYEYAEISFDCISTITAGKWPMKLVCSQILHTAPLFHLKGEDFLSLFGHLYNLHSTPPLEYASSSEEQKCKHRMEFMKYILSFPFPSELSSQEKPSVLYQPILPIFYQLACHASSGSQFQILISQELFFFAFSLSLPSCATSDEQVRLVSSFQHEARYWYGQLLEKNAALMPSLIFCLAQHLHSIQLDWLQDVLKPCMFTNWPLDLYSLNLIASFFAQWPFPPSCDDDVTQDVMITLINNVVKPPPLQCSLDDVHRGIRLGSILFGLLNWKLVTSRLRLYSGLILIGVKMPLNWSMLHILGELGRVLLASPLDELFVQSILTVNPSLYPNVASKLTILQLYLGLGILGEQYAKHGGHSIRGDISQGHNWLVGWGFYTRIHKILEAKDGIHAVPFIANLLIHIDIVKEEASAAAPFLCNVIKTVHNISNHSKSIQRLLQEAMLQSFKVNSRVEGNTPQDNEKRLQLWLEATTPFNRNDTFCAALLNDLIAFAYCSGYSLESAVTLLQKRKFSHQDILHFRNDGYLWIVLLILYTYEPAPTLMGSERTTCLFLLRESAQQQTTHAVAIALWLHFFMILFKVDPEGHRNVVNDNVKKMLNKHFIFVAKHFEQRSTTIYRLYYAFSTWKKAIIDSATGDFHEEQTINLLDDIYASLPMQFHNEHFGASFGVSTVLPSVHGLYESLPFAPLAGEETEDSVLADLPATIPPPSPGLPVTDKDEYLSFEDSIQHGVLYFTELSQQGGNFDPSTFNAIQIPSISHLLALLENHKVLCGELGALDQAFLHLVQKNFYNFQKPFQVSVPCQTDKACVRPAIIQGTSVEIGPSTPNVNEDIQRNREEYAVIYTRLFDMARALSKTTVLLRCSLEIALEEKQVSSSLAISIFFAILETLFLQDRIPEHSPISCQMVDLLLYVGRKYILGQPDQQLLLLQSLLLIPSTVMFPSKIHRVAIPSDSIASFVGREENEKKQDCPTGSVPADLYELFTPQCFHDITTYLRLLQMLVEQDGKSEEELKRLSCCFDPATFLTHLGEPTEEIINALFKVAPGLLASRNFSEIGMLYLHYIMKAGHQHRVLGILLSSNVEESFASEFIRKLNFGAADLPTIKSVLANLVQCLPFSNAPIYIVCELLESVTVQSAVFMSAFREENHLAYDSAGKPIESSLWNVMYQLICGKGIIRQEASCLEDSLIARTLRLLLRLVRPNALAMVDKVWYLFANALLPTLGACNEARKDLSESLQVVADIANALPWEQSRFLLYDPTTLSTLDKHIHFMPEFICLVFSKLDWTTFTARLASSNQPKLIASLGITLLKLLLQVNLVGTIPSELSAKLIPSGAQDGNGALVINWASIPPSLFLQHFTGDTLLPLVQRRLASGGAAAVPSIKSTYVSLKAIALQMNHHEAAAGCVFEASAFFQSFLGRSDYATNSDVLRSLAMFLLTDVILPLTHEYGDSPSITISRGMAQSVLESLRLRHQLPVEPLVLQFCSSVTPGLSLHLLKECKGAGSLGENVTIPLWVDIYERTLRTFFTSATMPNPLREASNTICVAKENRREFIECAKNTSSGLALLALLDHCKHEAEENQASQWPSDLFEFATGFMPSQHRTFDFLPICFFIVELVESPRFHPVQGQQDAWKLLDYIKQICLVFKADAPVVLAAKALEIFFFRLIRGKSNAPNPRGDAALRNMMEHFLKMRSQSAYRNYASFFDKVGGSIQNSFYDRHCLQRDILETLFPIAQPLLEILFSPPNSDLQL